MTIKAHFDGKVIVPDEPVDLPVGQQVELQVVDVGPKPKKYMTARELAESPVVGMWADRTDITDSTEFVNELRRRIERREL
jgi:hypothetical protein